MNFDVVIIGGGLAGLTCGIALQEQGKRCAIINGGQTALDFSSGSLDLLGKLPSGKNVENFDRGFVQLAQEAPLHPYVILGQTQVSSCVQRFEQLGQLLGLNLVGSYEQNHWRVTPLGGLRATWLSPNSVPCLPMNADHFQYHKIAVLGIEGYHDFQPQMLAENLKLNPQFADCELIIHYLHIPELDHLRAESREFRSVNIAQLLEHKLAFESLMRDIQQAAGNADAVFLPACFGLDDQHLFNQLKAQSRLPLFELPTLPPSLLGGRQHKILRHHFERLGGLMINGDRALRAEFDGHRIRAIYTSIHEQIAIRASDFVLASGGFFSNGLVAEFDGISEPLFKSDIIQLGQFTANDRFSWTVNQFNRAQPYQSAGVIINERCQVQKNGEFLANLYAVGDVIGGYNGIELGCGSGVAIVTAFTAAQQIGGKK